MLKAYIENIVSLERLLSNIDAEQLTSELAKNCKAKIATSEAKLEQIEQFKMSLYENLVEEIISKDEHRLYKKKYDEESKQIETALDGLRRELDDITGNRAEYERQISESMNEITTLETGLNAFEAQAVKQAEWTESMKHLQSGGELTALLINRLVERIEISHDKTITVILKTTEVTI